MSTTLSPSPVQKFFDNNGNPLANGQLFTYQAGTQTPASTYTDSTGVTQNPNPVVLNARGEAQVWIPPNTAYKYVLQDAFGNTIWTVDQIINAQLLTLYGGVDTGSANAYVLNFTAGFSAYTDGIIVYWIPAHTNTGASTININGLGVINLTNQDGSALRAGQVAPNLVATLLIKGGAALLLGGNVAGGVLATAGSVSAPSIAFAGDPTTGFYFGGAGLINLAIAGSNGGQLTFGIATGSLNGVSGTVNFNAPYRLIFPMVLLALPQVSGTSNSTSFTATISTAAVRPILAAQWISLPAMEDNSAQLYTQVGYVAPSGTPGQTTIVFYKNGNAVGWTNSGTKGIGDGSVVQGYNVVAYSLI